MSKRLLVVLVSLFILVVSTTAFAVPPLRTLGRPFLHNSEMSLVKFECPRGCYEIRNVTSSWIVPGNNGPGAAPGQALIFDSATSGVAVGVYLGHTVQTGVWIDTLLGQMPAIDGQFVSALPPRASAYVKVDQGVTEMRAWSLDFEPELNAVGRKAYDVRLGRVVEYTPGVAKKIGSRDCELTKNPFVDSSDPHLAMVTNQSCIH